MVQFNLLKLSRGETISAVYKMIFDDGFYIGGTLNVRERMSQWKFRLSNGYRKNINVTNAFKKTSSVSFEIIEIVEDYRQLKFREDYYIKNNWGNPALLNRSDDAFINRVKRTPEQIEAMKGRRNPNQFIKVAKFNLDNKFIEFYDCIADAAKDNNVSPKDVSRCTRRSGRQTGGYTYKKVDNEGVFIEPPVIPREKVLNRKKVSESGLENMRKAQQRLRASPNYKYPEISKPVVKYDTDGNKLEEFRSVGELARLLNCNDRNLKKVINGKRSKTGYFKGFIYKYA